MMTTPQEPLSDLDRRALERAVAIEQTRNEASRDQIDRKLRGEPWLKVAVYCAERCQEISLHLEPWEYLPPCAVEVNEVDAPGYEHQGVRKSAALLRRMLRAGVSRYEPDPLAALAQKENGPAKGGAGPQSMT
jgi:hypothetical protein